MSKIDEIINVLKSHSITDIFIVGFIDNSDDLKEFYPKPTDVYLEFGNTLLRCSSVNQYDKLRMAVVEKIEFDFEIEEDCEFCFCRVSNMYLSASYGTNKITSAQFLLDDESNLDEGMVKCARLSIDNGDYLFLDPTHTFGLQINGKRSIIEWIEKNAYGTPKYSEFVWQESGGATELRPISLII